MAATLIERAGIVAALAATMTGCAPAHQTGKGALGQRVRFETPLANEQVFSIRWWARADETWGLPYRPVEPGEPEVDPKNGHVFVGTVDGKVRAFDGKGQPLWEYDAQSAFDAGPTLADGRLYVAASKGMILALDATSGKKLWEYSAAEEFVTKPVIADGLVIVMSTADTIYAIDLAKGEWRWQYRREVPSDFTLRGASRPQVANGRVYAGFADGYAVALDLKDGTLTWAKELGAAKQFADVDAGPVTGEEGQVYFASVATGVYALEGATGKILWTSPRPGVSALALDPTGRRLYVGGNGFLGALMADSGAVSWNATLGTDQFVSGLAVVNSVLLASTGPGPMLFLDGATGRLRNRFDPGRGVWARANVQGGQAIVLSNRGVVYDLGIEGRP